MKIYNKRRLIIILVGIILLSIFNIYNQLDKLKNKASSGLVLYGWTYREGNGVDIDTINMELEDEEEFNPWVDLKTYDSCRPNNLPLRETWMKIDLPENTVKDSVLAFSTYESAVKVYLDDELIYDYGNKRNIRKNKIIGSPYHIVTLPEDYSNKKLFIKLSSSKENNLLIDGKVQIDSKSNIILNMIYKHIQGFIFAAIFIFIAFGGFLLRFIVKRYKNTFIYIGFVSLSTGLWLMSESPVKQLFFNYPIFWQYILIISLYFIPIFFSLLINELFKGRVFNLVKYNARIHTIIVLIALVLEFTSIYKFQKIISLCSVTCIFSVLVSISIIVQALKKGRENTKIIILGIVFLCVMGTIDIFNSVVNYTHSEIFFTQWGMLIFLFFLVIAIIIQYLDNMDKVKRYSFQIRQKDRKLIEKDKQINEIMNNDKLKVEFYSNITHELRTPLNIILGSVQLLNLYLKEGTKETNSKNIDKYLKSMKQNSYRLIRLVNNLIDMTKIDSNFYKLELGNYNFIRVAEEITLSVADYIKSKGKNLIFDTDVEELIVACDPEKIERIMLNLLSNAVKFSYKESTIKVLIDTQTEVGYVMVSVIDNGIGLPKDKLESVFERFVQVDKELSKNYEGSGIGLSLVKSLVEMHGGKITVESEYGVGTTFKFILPIKQIEGKEINLNTIEFEGITTEKVNVEFWDIIEEKNKD